MRTFFSCCLLGLVNEVQYVFSFLVHLLKWLLYHTNPRKVVHEIKDLKHKLWKCFPGKRTVFAGMLQCINICDGILVNVGY